MYPNESYKIVGLVTILIFWLVTLVVLRMQPKGKALSISLHLAANKKISFIYSLVICPTILAFYFFMDQWFAPTFQLMFPFKIVLITGVILQVLTLIIPLRKGWRYVVHELCSYGAASLYLVLLLLLLPSDRLVTMARLVVIMSIVVMMIIVGLFLFRKKTYGSHLVYQLTYFALFNSAILCATYTVR